MASQGKKAAEKKWRKAPEKEKEGIDLLQAEIKRCLSTLSRAENLRRRHKLKERTRANLLKDPFKFVKIFFTKDKSGKLNTSKKDLEAYLKANLIDSQRFGQTALPPDMPPVHSQEHQLDIRPPKWSEVERIVHQARAASSPGPNGVPCRFYKNAPKVTTFSLEADEGGVAETSNSNRVAEGRRHPNPQGKGLCGH